MRKSGFDRALDYFPIMAYAGFWLQGGLAGAIITGDPGIMKLGIVTLPAVTAMILAIKKISGKHRDQTRMQE